MRFLVDLHVLLWAAGEPERLSARARDAFLAIDAEPLLSASVVWELASKWGLGKLALQVEPADFIGYQTMALNLSPLPITQLHALRTGDLPHHHKDPFDRLLVAQAVVERVPIVSSDIKLRRYGVEVIW